MELEGLRRMKANMENHRIAVRVLVTDRHLQLQKWIRENWVEVRHYYDVWHIAKGTVLPVLRPYIYIYYIYI